MKLVGFIGSVNVNVDVKLLKVFVQMWCQPSQQDAVKPLLFAPKSVLSVENHFFLKNMGIQEDTVLIVYQMGLTRMAHL